jgi:hypothetical protein
MIPKNFWGVASKEGKIFDWGFYRFWEGIVLSAGFREEMAS